MQCFGHATNVKYERGMREMMGTNMLFERDVVAMSHRCLPRPFQFLNLIREVDFWAEIWVWNCYRG